MSEPIRVLHILQRMEAGGSQTLLMNLYRNINRNKVQFDFLVEYKEKYFYDDEVTQLGGKIYYTSVRQDFNILKFTRQLRKILQEGHYTIIHVHAYTIGYFVLKVAKECGVKVRIVHSHSNSMIRDWRSFPKWILQKLYPIYATDFFASSEDAGNYIFKHNNFIVLKNGIDTTRFQPNLTMRKKVRSEMNLENDFVIGHVGRFNAAKNHNFLLDVFANIVKIDPNAKLLLVGSGELEKKIKEKVYSLKLENNILFLGNRKNMEDIYQAMDVFVLPSIFEGLGIVGIEAQACGVPTLCSEKIPDEANVSPLFYKMSLSEDPIRWAKKIIEISKDKYAHKNVKKYIKNSGFDIKESTEFLENFYINKAKENREERQ